MKHLIKTTILVLTLALGTWAFGQTEDDLILFEKVEQAQPVTLEQMMDLKAQWDEYKEQLNGNYQIWYSYAGFVANSRDKYFTEVRDGETGFSTEDITPLTMDVLFDLVINGLADPENAICKHSVAMASNQKTIEVVVANCRTETSIIWVREFIEGHQVTFTPGPKF